MRRFEGKVVLVIGGGTGMGRATADSFADEGATVVVSEIPAELGREAVVGIDTAVRGQEAVEGIKARGGKAFLVHCNIGKRDEVKAMIDEAARLAGGIDILVNTVEPGLTATDRLKSKMPMDFIDAAAANFPVPRAGQPEDIANAIRFLASEDASYITGASLLVDGGASMASLTAVTNKASH